MARKTQTRPTIATSLGTGRQVAARKPPPSPPPPPFLLAFLLAALAAAAAAAADEPLAFLLSGSADGRQSGARG